MCGICGHSTLSTVRSRRTGFGACVRLSRRAGRTTPACTWAGSLRRGSTWASGTGACRSSTSPAATSPWPTRTGRSGLPTTARSTTTTTLRARARGQGAPLPQRLGHRGHRPPLRGARARLPARRLNGMFAFALWDDRAAASGSGARPARDQAAVLLLGRRPPALRLGDQGAADRPGGRPAPRPRGAHALPGLRLRAGARGRCSRASASSSPATSLVLERRPGRDLALLGSARPRGEAPPDEPTAASRAARAAARTRSGCTC